MFTQNVQSIQSMQYDLNLLPLHTSESDRPAWMYYPYLRSQNF